MIYQIKLKMFADDAKAYCRIKSVEDARGLQQDLNFLSSMWSRDWLVEFNGKKCKRMHLGTKNPKFEYSLQVRNSGEDSTVTLDETSEEKDLGVLIDNQLKFSKHIQSIVADANKS